MTIVVERGLIIYSFLDDEGRVVYAHAGNPDVKMRFESLSDVSAGPFTLVMHQLVRFEFESERRDPRVAEVLYG